MSMARIYKPIVGVFAVATLIAACGKTKETIIREQAAAPLPLAETTGPIGQQTPDTTQKTTPEAVQKTTSDAPPANMTSAEVKVVGDISFTQDQFKALMAEPLLYGYDLQYAGMSDGQFGFTSMTALAGGAHRIAHFQRVGSKVLLTADDSMFFESDFNLQENLFEFDVLSETDTTINLRASSVALGAAKAFQITPDGIRTPWIRSIEFDANGQYLLIESSLRDTQGGVYNFLETAFPRKNLGDSSRALMLNADKAAAEPEGYGKLFQAVQRLGVFTSSTWSFLTDAKLPWDATVTKKQKDAVLRYDISDKKTIDWWVTDNVTPELENDIRAGVEGWNRYFKDFRTDSPVVVFKGKLPKTVKLGDPRFNVVLFDKVQDAGAAYESQDFDPETGLQSHSMIYMPYAWYNFGKSMFLDGVDKANDLEAQQLLDSAMRYVNKTGEKEELSLAEKMGKSKFFKKDRVHCLRDVNFNEGISAIVSETGKTAEDAGRALLRSTLLHEVGHALGMKHNFRGSMAGKTENKKTASWKYSSSVMDYNAPQLEDDELFKSLNKDGSANDASVGTILPYDRQFIDIIYNNAQQVLAEPKQFPVTPYCSDEEADDKVLGANANCIRYDFFSDAISSIKLVRDRILASTSNLPQSQGGYSTLQGMLDARKQIILGKIATAKNASELISNAAQPGVIEAALLQEIPEVVAYFTGGAETRSKSYIGYRALTSRYLALLGEWKPLPNFALELETAEMKESETFTALKEGWNAMPIFDDKGVVSKALYTQYQADTRAQIMRSAIESFETRTVTLADKSKALCRVSKSVTGTTSQICSTDSIAEAVKADAALVTAAARARATIAEIATAAIASGLLDEATKETLSSLISDSQKLIEAQAGVPANKVAIYLAGNLPTSGVLLPTGDLSVGRGTVNTNIVKALFDAAQNLAAESDSANKISSRAAATSLMSKILMREKGWDSLGVRSMWQNGLRTTGFAASRDFKVLDLQLKNTNYLSEKERTNHELLARMSNLVEETLKPAK